MASFTWPASLPSKPQFSSFQEKRPDMVLKSNTDKGPGLRRRKCGSMPYKTSVEFVFNKDQLNTFIDFVANSLGEGTYLYEWTEPILGTTIDCAINGDGTDLYTIAQSGPNIYLVKFDILVYP